MTVDFVKHDSAADLKISNEVALTLAKDRKVFWDGKIIKECAIKTPLAFGNKKLAKNFKNVPLFQQIVARRVAELNDNLILQLKEIVQQCNYFLFGFE